MPSKQSLLILGCTLFALLFLVFLGTRNYEGNVSTLLHMDVEFGTRQHVPSGLVLYQDSGYDGMLYYQVARDIPALFGGGHPLLNSPYRFQRILLPLLGYVVTLGNDREFPIAFLCINLAAAIGALALTLSLTKKLSVHALTIVANPAILVGILFSLTEPLSLFFIVLFFWLRKCRGNTIGLLCAGALFLSLLARETTVFLIGLLFLWSLWRKQWKEALLILIPIVLFAFWQYFLVVRLGSVAFQANSNILNIPFKGPLTMIRWLLEQTGLQRIYRLSSLSLLSFLLPLAVVLGREWIREGRRIGVFCFLLTGLSAVMLTIDAHMWGVITSIGRVVTPFYPVYALYAAERDTWTLRTLSVLLIVLSCVAAIGIAFIRHPFVIS